MEESLEHNETHPQYGTLSKPFWVVWMIELWERFGFYGTQAILAVYFVHHLGYTEKTSFYVFGSFSAFAYGFVWIGGYIGDKYLGIKRTIIFGAVLLMFSYASLALATKATIFYSLAAIIVGNALFKANPSSLISKLYKKGDSALDSAMTMYYMAINAGAFISMAITPIIAKHYGWSYAFWISAIGLLVGIINYFIFRHWLDGMGSKVGSQPIKVGRLLCVLFFSIVAIALIAQLLSHTAISTAIVYLVVTCVFLYFIKTAFTLKGKERARMLVGLLLIVEAIVFFTLYNQMPTSLTFYAQHNINRMLWGMQIPAAEYQVLNPFVIMVMSPVLAWLYPKFPATHVTKFCIGMTLCAIAFLILWFPQYTAVDGLASPWWMVLTYFFQSTGELFVSALGLAMVAELCPRQMSGFVMGVWFIGNMLAGPIGAWVGALTAPNGAEQMSAIITMPIYSHVFLKIGLVTLVISLLMWMSRPFLTKYIR